MSFNWTSALERFGCLADFVFMVVILWVVVYPAWCGVLPGIKE